MLNFQCVPRMLKATREILISCCAVSIYPDHSANITGAAHTVNEN